MKPIYTLAWAVSAPILLFAGATHAVSLSELTDPGCNGTFVFDSPSNKIACQATSAPPPSDPPPSDPPPSDPPPSDPPISSQCPATPAGTVIVKIGSRDYYTGKDFDVVFDNPGASFDSAVAAGESKALQFSNEKSLTGYFSATTGNNGGGSKDWAVSLCPGDFISSLGAKCVQSKKSSINMGYSTDGSLGCRIPANQPIYLNVRGTGGIAAGWVVENLELTATAK